MLLQINFIRVIKSTVIVCSNVNLSTMPSVLPLFSSYLPLVSLALRVADWITSQRKRSTSQSVWLWVIFSLLFVIKLHNPRCKELPTMRSVHDIGPPDTPALSLGHLFRQAQPGGRAVIPLYPLIQLSFYPSSALSLTSPLPPPLKHFSHCLVLYIEALVLGHVQTTASTWSCAHDKWLTGFAHVMIVPVMDT